MGAINKIIGSSLDVSTKSNNFFSAHKNESFFETYRNLQDTYSKEISRLVGAKLPGMKDEDGKDAIVYSRNVQNLALLQNSISPKINLT